MQDFHRERLPSGSATPKRNGAIRMPQRCRSGSKALSEKTEGRTPRRSVGRERAYAGRKDGSAVLISSNGALQFVVEAHGAQVFLSRIQRRPLGVRLILSMTFVDRQAFADWCDREPTRFDHPLLFDRLRRQVDEVFGSLA